MLGVLWLIYLLVNVIAFVLYGVDKRHARRGEWRIPERTLMTVMWRMGGVGAQLGMKVFHHKTRHNAFVMSAPIAATMSLLVMVALTLRMLGWL